jgi:hypothetical protein
LVRIFSPFLAKLFTTFLATFLRPFLEEFLDLLLGISGPSFRIYLRHFFWQFWPLFGFCCGSSVYGFRWRYLDALDSSGTYVSRGFLVPMVGSGTYVSFMVCLCFVDGWRHLDVFRRREYLGRW